MKYLLVGYGNPLRSDDGLGPHVAAAFRDAADDLMGEVAADLHVVAVPQLLPELAEMFAAAERVVLVDASRGHVPGEISARRVEPVEASGDSMIHAYDPATLAAWAGSVYGRAPEVIVVAVGAESFGFGQGLSPAVAAAVPRVLDTVARLLVDGMGSA